MTIITVGLYLPDIIYLIVCGGNAIVVGKHQIIHSLSVEMSSLTRDGTTAELVWRDQILTDRRERGQGNIYFPCSADDPVDP